MKYKQFDVVKLKNGYNATILGLNDNKYNVEIVDNEGKRKELSEIQDDDILEYVLKK